MNRNVSIIIVILVLVVVAGYLVWIRSKYQPPVSPNVEQAVQVTPTSSFIPSASASATPVTKEATGSTKQKTSTPSSTSK